MPTWLWILDPGTDTAMPNRGNSWSARRPARHLVFGEPCGAAPDRREIDRCRQLLQRVARRRQRPRPLLASAKIPVVQPSPVAASPIPIPARPARKATGSHECPSAQAAAPQPLSRPGLPARIFAPSSVCGDAGAACRHACCAWPSATLPLPCHGQVRAPGNFGRCIISRRAVSRLQRSGS